MVKKISHGSKKRKSHTHRVRLSGEDAKTEKILIENFVALQRVITHLSEKFDHLANQISKMLNLFEISAKSLAEKEFNTKEDTREVKRVVEKLDGLLEQNKTLAKGLLLLHDEVSPNKVSVQKSEVPAFIQRPKPNLTPPPERYSSISAPTPSSSERYQKSISSEQERDFSSRPRPPMFKPLSREGNE